MKIIAFGASYSKQSINRRFAFFAAKQFENADIELLDLNDYQLPVFTIDEEAEIGHPAQAKLFIEKMAEADLLVISMAEHNGSYTAAFKNLFDWASRTKMTLFEGKKMLLLSAAPGPRGGSGALEAAKSRFPRHGAQIVAAFSLPNFEENFDAETGISNNELNAKFSEAITATKNNLAGQ